MKTLIQGGTLVTMDSERRTFRGDLLIDGRYIKKIAKKIDPIKENVKKIISAENKFVIPGLIQAHTHLVQTLFRGYADDLPLLEWLKKKIWPMEFHHNKKSIRASAKISLLEMQLLGTTSILDMATVHLTNEVLEEVEHSNMRYWGGKCLMDYPNSSGPLYEPTGEALKETEELITEWHQKTDLINYAICPRFAVACTDELLRASSDLQKQYNVFLHTHASESLEEIEVVRKRTGFGNIDYLDHLGLLNSKSVIIHGVHMTDDELMKMIANQTPLVHCPSSNLKLASGVAPIEMYLEKGLKVGLGADGAPCNNTMDPFMEMRLAALIQKPLFGPEALPAEKAFEMATLGGAKVLCEEDRLGSLEEGKLADIVTVDREHPSVATVENPYSALVYSCSGRDVNDVFINGKLIVRNKKHKLYDRDEVIAESKKQLKRVLSKI
ncbi:MAG: amidohydrolase family protein [Bdellovibrionales bacterium]|nr:amidohydrolase family protein [Bdellovibrionales bacterium]